jgi:hypothetical protein
MEAICLMLQIKVRVFKLKTLDVRAYDGSSVLVTEDVVSHVSRKHSEVLSLLALTEEGFFDLLRGVLEAPHEAYIDSSGSRYFLKKLGGLYLNVVVDEGVVRTAYLISLKTHSRMRRRRWLQRLC